MGVGGFMGMGAIAMPFIPQMTPEQDLASGQRYFADRCSEVTRNRQINGSFGKGHLYCKCVSDRLAGSLNTGDEYRFAADMQTATGAERWLMQDTRMKASMKSVVNDFDGRLGRSRIAVVNNTFFSKAKACARSM
jgi:hypothetical protein